MSCFRRSVVLLAFGTACVQSKHGDGPSGPPLPGGEVRLLEDRPGRGRTILPGDRVRVEVTGRYANGEIWGRGPFTFIVGDNTYPGAAALRVGAVECAETARLLLERHANFEHQPRGGGTPLERLISVSAFHEGHFEAARLLVLAGAQTTVAAQRLRERLDDPGPGGFGFSNRPQARRILRLLQAKRR